MRIRFTWDLFFALGITLTIQALLAFVVRDMYIQVYSPNTHPISELFRVPIRGIEEIEDRTPRTRPIEGRELENRAAESFRQLAERLPAPPAEPPLVAEEIESVLPAPGPVEPLPIDPGGLGESPPDLPDHFLNELLAFGDPNLSELPGLDFIESVETLPLSPLSGGELSGDPFVTGGIEIPSFEQLPPIDLLTPGVVEISWNEPGTVDLAVLPAPPIEVSGWVLDEPSLPPAPIGEEIPRPEVPTLEERTAVKVDPFIGVKVSTYRETGGQGYFQLEISPRESSGLLSVLPKDVIFVLDASNSMGEERMNELKAGIRDCLSRLRPGDRFNIVGFRFRPEPFQPQLVPMSSETIEAADRFIRNLRIGGRTEIYTSLLPLLDRNAVRGRPLCILLMTDGRPTVGTTDTETLIRELTANNQGGGTIFAIGAGRPRLVNRPFLEMLTYLNRGDVTLVHDQIETRKAVPGLFERIEEPLLIDIEGDFGAIPRDQVFPAVLPDLYRKGAIRVYGKFRNEQDLYFRLEGTGAKNERMDYVARIDLPPGSTGGPDIARAWAMHKIYSLHGKMAIEGHSEPIAEEIRRLAQQYGIAAPFGQ